MTDMSVRRRGFHHRHRVSEADFVMVAVGNRLARIADIVDAAAAGTLN